MPPYSNPHTPLSNVSGTQRLYKPSPIATSASSTKSTKWKNVDTPGPARQASPTRPSDRDISPISDRAPSPPPLPDDHGTTIQDTPTQMQKPAGKPRGGATRGRGGRGRGTKRGRGGRAVSSASSTRPERDRTESRSQSITSQADELSMDQSQSTRRIKPEPSAASVQEDDVSMASMTADENNRRPGRRRRGTMPTNEPDNTSHPTTNRKAEILDLPPPPSPASTQFSKPGFVLGTRNFPRTSQTLMNEIITHKVASLFAKPLTEREAPGYKDLIYRPQDLKSIKNAISAGGKALVAAAAENVEDVNRGEMNVWVPVSPDVVPPKGIVNSAQLEKELMRMFANAVMFNPDVPSQRGLGPAFRTRSRMNQDKDGDDDGDEAEESDEEQEEEEGVVKGKEDVSVVKDTREMFEAVRKSVAEWSGAERAVNLRGGGSEEMDELAGTGEDVMGSVEMDVELETGPRSRKRR